jgi:hypothetical protein
MTYTFLDKFYEGGLVSGRVSNSGHTWVEKEYQWVTDPDDTLGYLNSITGCLVDSVNSSSWVETSNHDFVITDSGSMYPYYYIADAPKRRLRAAEVSASIDTSAFGTHTFRFTIPNTTNLNVYQPPVGNFVATIRNQTGSTVEDFPIKFIFVSDIYNPSSGVPKQYAFVRLFVNLRGINQLQAENRYILTPGTYNTYTLDEDWYPTMRLPSGTFDLSLKFYTNENTTGNPLFSMYTPSIYGVGDHASYYYSPLATNNSSTTTKIFFRWDFPVPTIPRTSEFLYYNDSMSLKDILEVEYYSFKHMDYTNDVIDDPAPPPPPPGPGDIIPFHQCYRYDGLTGGGAWQLNSFGSNSGSLWQYRPN